MADDAYAGLVESFDEQVAAGAFDEQVDAKMADEIVPVLKSNAPVDTGGYRESCGIIEPARAGRGRVGSSSEIANIIEYGSVDTPEFAPVAKTVEYFQR
jgi:hypothetical protein